MKIFIRRRISFLLLFLLFLAVLQYLLIYLSLDHARDFLEIKREIMTLSLVFFLVQLGVALLIIAQIPYYLKKYLSILTETITDISSGNFTKEIDSEEYQDRRDREFVELITSFKKMMDIIRRFDSLKIMKIQEQRARIIALLSLTENGFLIVNRKGDIVYINYLISEFFPTIQEDMNILEANFSMEIDKNIKTYILSVIQTKGKLMPKNFYMNTIKRHITLKSEIVRDSNGDFDGTIIGIYNLEKPKPNPDKQKELFEEDE